MLSKASPLDRPEPRHRLLGVVLAGGKSSRMGRDKAGLIHPCGTTFLEHALERVRGHCQALCVSLSANQTLPIPLRDDTLLRDPLPYRGPITGVAGGLNHAQRLQCDACLVTPVDMPDLSSDDLLLICQRWRRSPERIVCASHHDSGRLEPLVAIYPTNLAGPLAKAAASQDRSLYRWIQPRAAIAVPLTPSALRNVNSPADLHG